MDDVDDLYVVGANTVDQDVVGMHNGFACPINPAGAIEGVREAAQHSLQWQQATVAQQPDFVQQYSR